jgi:hypothetical protein
MRSRPWRGIFNDLLERIDRRRYSRRIDLSLESCWPSSFHLNFCFKASRKTSSFDLPRSHWPLSFRQDLFLVQTKRPLGFHEKAMHLLCLHEWKLKSAILIDYFRYLNSISFFNLWTTSFFHFFSSLNDLMKICLLGESTRARWSCDWRLSGGVTVPMVSLIWS